MFLCLLHCVKQILPFTRSTPDEVQIDFVFDQKPELEQRIGAIFFQLRHLPDLAEFHHRFGDVRFAWRRETPALQAADLLVYECFKHMINARAGFPRPPRKSLARLQSRIVHAAPLPGELLKRVGREMIAYYDFLASLGIRRERINTL